MANEPKKKTPSGCAFAVLAEFAEGIACMDVWVYGTPGLLEHEDQLRRQTKKMASDEGLSEQSVALAERMLSIAFWRWVGMREGWEAKEQGLDDPHVVLPFSREDRME